MVFTLQPLRALDGDCLLLEYGKPDNIKRILIDGGPRIAFSKYLKPRLNEVSRNDDPQRLFLELVIASHSDVSHLGGLLELTESLIRESEDHRRMLLVIREFWHNSLEALLGASRKRIIDLINKEAQQHVLPPALLQLLESIEVSRRLTDNAKRLGLTINTRRNGNVITSGARSECVNLEGGLRLRILGPFQGYIDDLRADWEGQINRLARASVTRYLGDTHSVTSIYFLAEYEDKTMLFTADARGDHVLGGLRAQGLLGDKPLHVDVLKVPNHGASWNVDATFYRSVVADHYVVSANGKHGNPEIATLQMIIDSRRDESFHIHLSHPPEEFDPGYPVEALMKLFFGWWKEGKQVKVHAPRPGGPSPVIALLDTRGTAKYIDYRSPESLWTLGAGSRVFLSYTQRDSAFMLRLKGDLQAAGFDVWTADADLRPGTPDWTSKVEAALDKAHCMVVVLSPNAKKSLWVKRELYYAETRRLGVIPVLASGTAKAAVPLEIAHMQHIDATNRATYAKAVRRVVEAAAETCRPTGTRGKKRS
jgi:hypothetical protein